MDDLPRVIDHTNLRPCAVRADIARLVDEAVHFGFASVCVNLVWAPFVRRLLDQAKTAVRLCTVVGFPLGADGARAKSEQARIAVDEGADEVDMVIDIGALKERDYDRLAADARAVLDACQGRVTKAIIETCYLDDEEKVKACQLLDSLGYNFVKTSTGLATHGATVEDVRLMRSTVSPRMGVKASGGIRCYDDAIAMVRAGANRIGTSSGTAIIREWEQLQRT